MMIILNPFIISVVIWTIILAATTVATISIPHHGLQLVSAMLTGMAARRLIDVARLFLIHQAAVKAAFKKELQAKLQNITQMIKDLPVNPDLSKVQDMEGEEIVCEQCGFKHLPENWEFIERQAPEDESIDVYKCISCGHLAYVRNKG